MLHTQGLCYQLCGQKRVNLGDDIMQENYFKGCINKPSYKMLGFFEILRRIPILNENCDSKVI
jgi:lipid A disaccharide synthetase